LILFSNGDLASAIARGLAKIGDDIALGDLADSGEALKKQIESLGRKVCYHQVDVSKPEDVQAWVSGAEKILGPATLIIPNAGIFITIDETELGFEKLKKIMDVNLNGAYYLARIASRRLIALGKKGRVIFMGSCAGTIPQAPSILYCTSKAGVRMMSRCMAIELSPHGILVNEVAPGNVKAGMAKKMFDEHPGLEQKSARIIPVRKNVEIEDVVYQFLYLSDPRNDQITGSTIEVDGGIRLAFPLAIEP
jgi:glucose 1-dehydrogenase